MGTASRSGIGWNEKYYLYCGSGMDGSGAVHRNDFGGVGEYFIQLGCINAMTWTAAVRQMFWGRWPPSAIVHAISLEHQGAGRLPMALLVVRKEKKAPHAGGSVISNP